MTVTVGHRIPSKPRGKKYLNLSEKEREEESNKIPWLRGSCGILVLTESSSSLHSAVCFGRLSEVEICSSIPPTALSQQQTTLKRTARQPLRHFRQRRLAFQRRVFTDNAVSADTARLKANYLRRIKPTLRR